MSAMSWMGQLQQAAAGAASAEAGRLLAQAKAALQDLLNRMSGERDALRQELISYVVANIRQGYSLYGWWRGLQARVAQVTNDFNNLSDVNVWPRLKSDIEGLWNDIRAKRAEIANVSARDAAAGGYINRAYNAVQSGNVSGMFQGR